MTIPPFVRWAFIDAVWSAPNGRACRNPGGEEIGACWAFIGEKLRFILFGRYPYDEQWRPLVVVLIFVAMIAASCDRRLWGRMLLLIWLVGLVAVGVLMWGGIFGLPYVETLLWSGLPLTLILAVIGMAMGFPLGVALALGRRSELPAVRAICVAYIELVRGVPLITVLFMASVMLPLFLPTGMTIDKLLRAQVAFILFSAAYLAEIVRGGLQAIPKGQIEAADSLGLGYWRRTRLIVLAAGAVAGDPAAGQHVHRDVQGHLAGHHHRPVRPARHGQRRARRRGVAGLQRRSLYLRRRDLFRVLLFHVALQRDAGTRVQPQPPALSAATLGCFPPSPLPVKSGARKELAGRND